MIQIYIQRQYATNCVLNMTVKEHFYNMFYKGDIKQELKEGQDYDN